MLYRSISEDIPTLSDLRNIQSGLNLSETFGCINLDTQLIHAISDGRVMDTKSLLNQGANVNAQRHDGFTALMIASFFDYVDIASLLLDHGADLSITDHVGMTALDWANAKANYELVALLRDAHKLQSTIQYELPKIQEEASEPQQDFSNIQSEIPEPQEELSIVEVAEEVEVAEDELTIVETIEFIEEEEKPVFIEEVELIEDESELVALENLKAKQSASYLQVYTSNLEVINRAQLIKLDGLPCIEEVAIINFLPIDQLDGEERTDINNLVAEAIEEWLGSSPHLLSLANTDINLEKSASSEDLLAYH
jgi:hypothetical protein